MGDYHAPTPPGVEESDIYTVAETAKILRYTERHVRKLLADGELATSRGAVANQLIGTRIRLLEYERRLKEMEELEERLEALEQRSESTRRRRDAG